MGFEGPSRREFIKMAGAALATPALEKAAHAAETKAETPRTPEQDRVYQEGLRELAESANNATIEISRVFIAYPDGRGEWRDVAATVEMALQTEAGSAMRIRIANEAWEEATRPLSEGALIEDFHTHPTRALLGNPREQTPLPGTDRIPPSPLDVLQSLETVASLQEDARGRYKTSVVTEAGVWRYGARSSKAATDLVAAFRKATPILERLKSEHYQREARVLAPYLREQAEKSDEEILQKTLVELATLIEGGAMARGLIAHGGTSLDSFSAMLQILDDSDRRFPARAKNYVSLVRNARAEMVRALRVIAPETDGMIGSAPLLADFENYVSRWRSLGVDMEFEPFIRD